MVIANSEQTEGVGHRLWIDFLQPYIPPLQGHEKIHDHFRHQLSRQSLRGCPSGDDPAEIWCTLKDEGLVIPEFPLGGKKHL